jgi:CBS domain-containing protein
VVQLGDIMTPDVFTLPPEVTVAEAATAMVKGRFGSVLLVRDDQLVGILTERDVLRAAASGSDLAVAPASEWMTRDPVTVRPDMDTEDAAQIMADRGFRHLPIIEDDEVAGVVSLRDVLAARIRPRHLE